ncbi:ExbD/TolR family protein [Kaistella jeonii]|uniref:Biopolymer transporter ExbD n=1 Tax=Kaistella jeonii TaxID=266749 RepID=A0A0C1D7K5_9FLAO|nr:biopolymer transporter ExbD [Kaistella jeonii]KIA89875.1 biopolymer transporter ExbD [Kaistella jeonii]SFB81929.1 Biopolymer transport protein ExbD [Kaistella jeonii]VEI96115.1 Biopolymer transport protein ExbD/TolR [Kaistella jeonii]
MAEVQVKDNGGKGGKVRSKKAVPHVDLTPMVDLAFLLITFFMLVTTFNKPNVMDLGLPAKPKDNVKPPNTEIDLSNSISLIIGKDNRIFYHQLDQAGLNDQTLQETTFDRNGITKVIEQAKANAKDQTKFTVIIKPTDDAVYKNFVDMLDQMAITKNEIYGITDIKPWEKLVYERKVGGSAATPAAPTN